LFVVLELYYGFLTEKLIMLHIEIFQAISIHNQEGA
jgi:hypothetical protein